ncbi:MAG: hypothetical protein L0Z63_09445 [Actinobacteria bacterium]|nr:hypothetical protein [Actinomycetota bacterium]
MEAIGSHVEAVAGFELELLFRLGKTDPHWIEEVERLLLWMAVSGVGIREKRDLRDDETVEGSSG